MDLLIDLLAPKSRIGFLVRVVVLTIIVAGENILFANYFTWPQEQGPYAGAHHLLHAAIVSGPLIAFFLAVIAFQVSQQRKFCRLSRKDGLTGLNNRRSFFEMVQKTRAFDHQGVLLVIDADRFKAINDTYGHQGGDKCLESISHTLRRSVRRYDILGRIGGEEFGLYLTGASTETARVIGERLSIPISFGADSERRHSVTLSIGAARAQPDLSIDTLFARADLALYQAKANGRAQYVEWANLAPEQRDARSA